MIRTSPCWAPRPRLPRKVQVVWSNNGLYLDDVQTLTLLLPLQHQMRQKEKREIGKRWRI
jgi:hypothetical protein